jgi:hypothetical protein
MTLLRATLRVAGEEPPTESRAVIDRVERVTGIRSGAFRNMLGHSRGDLKVKASDAASVTADYLVGVGELAEWVNAQVPP